MARDHAYLVAIMDWHTRAVLSWRISNTLDTSFCLETLDDGGNIDQTAQDALRRGWHLGEETFRDRLLDLVDKAKGVKARKRSRAECVGRDHGEKDAERLIRQSTPDLGLPAGAAELAHLRKGDGRKALLAALLRRRTSVGCEWIATRLHMGHPGSVSRLVCGVKRDRKLEIRVNELVELLQCADPREGGDWTSRAKQTSDVVRRCHH
jgi:hypothetical protein